MAVNKEYKDRLFKFIFGSPENKEWALSLYNAVNGTSYTEVENLFLTTVDDALYMGMKNDVSFLFADRVNIYEQQSSLNPNMPLRYLMYAGLIYSGYVKTKPLNIYSSRPQKIPAPRNICFYEVRQSTTSIG